MPVNNKNFSLRKLMTKDEPMDLIEGISRNETVEVEDARKKIQEYKSIIKSGNAEEIIKVINSIKLEETETASLGKKLNNTYEYIMGVAKKQLYEEFAIVLKINVDEVGDYIKNNI